jgi:TonB family protein
MFDVLVESNSDKGKAAKQSAYFGTTAIVLASLFLALFVWSLYSTNLGSVLGSDDLALDTLVAPVVVEDAPPPPPAPENKPQKQTQQENAPKNADVRQVLQQNIDTPPKEPPVVSTAQNKYASMRDNVPTIKGNRDVNAAGDAGETRTNGGGGGGSQAVVVKPQTPVEDDAPPPPKPSPKEEKPKVPTVVSGGVINGKAVRLVQPPYPPAAKAVHAGGSVNVQVLIDEQGNVVSATATSGHPLLRAAAVQAARASKFSPTQLSGQPVKVNGVIVYNFVAQ